MISISNAQRRPVPQANWVRTIHHGLPEKLLTPQPSSHDYLAVLGRIAPEKGVDRAIRIAIRCGIPLKIAAKVDRADQDYYDEVIRPLIDRQSAGRIYRRDRRPRKVGLSQRRDRTAGSDRLAGAVRSRHDRGDGLRHARDRLSTAARCRRSSRTALTGFVVEDEISAVAAVDRLAGLNRAAIRKQFETRFTARRMALDYLAAYRSLTDAAGPRIKLVSSAE